MINFMVKLADCLGVKMGETFKIADKCTGIFPHDYRITKKRGIERLRDGTNRWETLNGETFRWFLTADIKIVHELPWKPQQGEEYYVPQIAVHHERMYYKCIWGNDSLDMQRYNMLLVYKTKDKAIIKAKKMLTALWEEDE